MIKLKTKQYLIEIHNIQRKKSVVSNISNAIQSLADASRYIDSSIEDIENHKIYDYLVKIKKHIMTDSGLGAGFDENQDPDLISQLQNIVNVLNNEIDGIAGKYDMDRLK